MISEKFSPDHRERQRRHAVRFVTYHEASHPGRQALATFQKNLGIQVRPVSTQSTPVDQRP
jgi:hypothetical protein